MDPVPKPPVVFVDAAEEPWARIRPVLERRRGELADGAVMHVLTGRADVAEELTRWCAEHALTTDTHPSDRPDHGWSFEIRTATIEPVEES